MKTTKSIFPAIIIFSFLITAGCKEKIKEIPPAPNSKFGIVIHGGAGSISKGSYTPDKEAEYQEKLIEALRAGYKVLENGGSSLDAVEKSIMILEDSPLFNAGKGAVFTSNGYNELDASIMDGKTLNAGGVARLHHIKNPIYLARLVMEKSSHVLMVGDGAEEFAKMNGVSLVNQDYFYTEERWNSLQEVKKKELTQKKRGEQSGLIIDNQQKFGTVGCVALDKNGNLAAGTSTGGMTNKKYGRVGDSPIIGAGTYADNNTCAISSTGHGEYFIRNVVAYDISALMKYMNLSLEEAAEKVINKKLVEQGGSGGIIGIDKLGNITMPFNTEGMFRGYILDNGKVVVKMYKD